MLEQKNKILRKSILLREYQTCAESHFFKEKSSQVTQKSSHDFDFFEKTGKSQSHDFDFFQKTKKSQSHDFDFF
jgi:hypothetical protein